MTDELKQKAENFIIDRYKLNECYREDNEETREYMRMDVHSQYEEEYQLYLDATKDLEEENAELKEQLGDKVMQKQKDKADLVWKLKTANEQKTDQLTKAKELLTRFLMASVYFNGKEADLVEEAEQFISEVEK